MKKILAIIILILTSFAITSCGTGEKAASGTTGEAASAASSTMEAAATPASTAAAESTEAKTPEITYKLGTVKDEKLMEVGGRPYCIAFGSDGVMYAAKERDEIVKITPDGKVSPFFKTDETNSQMGVTTIWTVQMGPDGNLYVPAGDRMFKISPDGKATTLIKDPEVFPAGVTFDSAGNFYVTSGRKIFKYTSTLEKSVFVDDGKSINMIIYMDIKFDKDCKNLYVSNYPAQQLYKYPIMSDGSAGSQEIIFEVLKTLDKNL